MSESRRSSVGGGLRRLLAQRTKGFVAVYSLYFLNAVLNLVPGYSVQHIVDFLALGQPIRFAGISLPLETPESTAEAVTAGFLILGGMLALIVVANSIGVLMWRKGTRLIEKLIFDIKLDIHDHINNLSLRYFSSERTGRIMTKALADVNNFSNMLRQSFSLSYAMVQFVTAPLLMIFMSWQLFVLTILPAPLIVRALSRLRIQLRPMYRTQREVESNINSQLQESITGIREVKAFNLRERTAENYRESNDDFFHRQNAIMRIFSFNHQLQYGTKDLALVLTVIGGGVMAYSGMGGVTVGTVMSFAVLQNFLYGPIGAFFGFYNIIQQGMVSWQRIEEFLKTEPEVRDRPGARPFSPPVVRREIAFEKVSFAYEKEQRVLENVSFTVPRGQKVAIVGASGSGKSTLISCLLRFYDIQEGAIRIDGVDIRDYTQESLRAAVGIVFQETFLFYGTVLSNLQYVNPQKSFADIREACRQANILEDIERMPDGFETVVGERGATVSGGQRQRLGIARAFLRDPAIVILDEATSAVDSVTESLIQESLQNVLRDRTAFIIAHRLSTIRNCDQILVMDSGRVIQQGSHEELRNAEGMYRRLHEEFSRG